MPENLQPQDLVMGYWNVLSLTDFCERRHLPEPDMSGIFPDQQQTIQPADMTMGECNSKQTSNNIRSNPGKIESAGNREGPMAVRGRQTQAPLLFLT